MINIKRTLAQTRTQYVAIWNHRTLKLPMPNVPSVVHATELNVLIKLSKHVHMHN